MNHPFVNLLVRWLVLALGVALGAAALVVAGDELGQFAGDLPTYVLEGGGLFSGERTAARDSLHGRGLRGTS